MHIFALETDSEKFKKAYLHEGEREILLIRYHGFKFFLAAFRLLLVTFLIAAAATALGYAGGSSSLATLIGFVIWLIIVFPRLLSAFIDWRYDFTFVTTDKAVLVDQTSIFRQRVTPINLENLASVSTDTQFMNLFPFGTLRFHLKSGLGQDLVLPYIARADEAAAQIANVVTEYQRRKDLRRYGESERTGEVERAV